MYSVYPSFVLGFHGCDKSVADAVFSGRDCLRAAPKDYDWLGHGVYFWENSPERAMQWAKEKKLRSKASGEDVVTKPAVVGAVIDLGYCLNLLDSEALSLLRLAYLSVKEVSDKAGTEFPRNRVLSNPKGVIIRNLDCFVIEQLHSSRKAKKAKGTQEEVREFDSVRGVFVEGNTLYENAGFNEKNHIQICVRNPNCIKGYFRPLSKNAAYPLP